MSDRVRTTMNGDHTRVLLADDHPIVLSGLVGLIGRIPSVEIVATCPDGTEALIRIRELKPDVAILDMAMPGLTGLDVILALEREQVRTKVVILTASATDHQITSAVTHGAWGIVLKDSAADELEACLRAVVAGERWLKASVIEPAVRRESLRLDEKERYAGALSARERQIALLVARGLSNKEISRETGISDGTVKVHLHNIHQKLGVRNRTTLATVAQRLIEI